MFHPMGLKSGYMTVTPLGTEGCRRANGLLMASSVFERHLAVGSGLAGRSMPL